MRWLERTRRLRRNRFETYRKQTQSLKLDDETWDKIMDTIRAMEAEELRKRSAETVAVTATEAATVPTAKSPTATERTATAPATSATTNARRSRKRRYGTPGFRALRFAACALLVVGVGAASIAAPVVFDKDHNTAEAGAPLLPYQRIQFDCANVTFYSAKDGVYAAVPVLLSFPGDVPENITLSFSNANNVAFSTTDSVENLDRTNSSIPVTCHDGKVTLLASTLSNMTKWDLNQGNEPPPGWFWDPTDAIEIIERLRNCEVVAETNAGERFAFTINLDDFPTREAITDRLYSTGGYRLVYFTLDRKENL